LDKFLSSNFETYILPETRRDKFVFVCTY
jgi:hypothetical protein